MHASICKELHNKPLSSYNLHLMSSVISPNLSHHQSTSVKNPRLLVFPQYGVMQNGKDGSYKMTYVMCVCGQCATYLTRGSRPPTPTRRPPARPSAVAHFLART